MMLPVLFLACSASGPIGAGPVDDVADVHGEATIGVEPPSPRSDGAESSAPRDAIISPPPGLAHPVDARARLHALSHELPAGASSVVVHAPDGLRLDRVALVVYLHGWEGCAPVVSGSGPVACREGDPLQAGWGLASLHDAAGTNSIFVVPQLAWVARSSSPGRFSEAGFADRWLSELTNDVLVPQVGIAGLAAISEIVLVAHSGGYQAALSLAGKGTEWPIRSITMFDALYGGADALAAWVLSVPDRRVVSLHTAEHNTTTQSRLLARTVARRLGEREVSEDPLDVVAAIPMHRVVTAQSTYDHNSMPEGELTAVLGALLPADR